MNPDDVIEQLTAALEHVKRLEADAFLSDDISDAEVDIALRMAGGDPKAIGRRGVEQAGRLLAKKRYPHSFAIDRDGNDECADCGEGMFHPDHAVPAGGSYSETIIREGREAARREVEKRGGNARWCVMSEGFVWSLHRTEAAATRAADRLDREYDDITGGNPPLLCRGAEEGDSYDDLDIVREGSR
jgi:hypothetical protein